MKRAKQGDYEVLRFEKTVNGGNCFMGLYLL